MSGTIDVWVQWLAPHAARREPGRRERLPELRAGSTSTTRHDRRSAAPRDGRGAASRACCSPAATTRRSRRRVRAHPGPDPRQVPRGPDEHHGGRARARARGRRSAASSACASSRSSGGSRRPIACTIRSTRSAWSSTSRSRRRSATPGRSSRPRRAGRIYIDEVALDFPELRIVCGHIGWPWTEEMIAVAWKHANVLIDTSAHVPKHFPAEFVHFMKTFGKTKCCFASDWPLLAVGALAEGGRRARALGGREETLPPRERGESVQAVSKGR